MPKRTDIHKVLIIGSGPIVIGQACEFDYSGTQACKALRKLGYEIVLVNSNPATIMTDPETADVTYIEPLNAERLEQIIKKERPDALLPNLGGQSGLNLCEELYKKGILDKYNVQVIGVQVDAIERGEDRIEFKKTMNKLGIEMAQGYGMSECSPKISSPDWSRPDKIASVGRVVEGCQVRIVDDEIQVKSPSVMMGYYKDPENTAQALTEDGWLRTGDIGYVDEEQFLYLTGRKKNLIITKNGENVSPEELENILSTNRLVGEILVREKNGVIEAEIYPDQDYVKKKRIKDVRAALQDMIDAYNKTAAPQKKIYSLVVRDTEFEKTTTRKIKRF